MKHRVFTSMFISYVATTVTFASLKFSTGFHHLLLLFMFIFFFFNIHMVIIY